MQARHHLPTLDQVLTRLEATARPGVPGSTPADGLTVVIARNAKQLARLRCDEAAIPPTELHTLVGRAAGPLAEALVALPAVSLVIDTRGPSGPQQGRLFEAAYFALDPGARWVALLDDGLGAAMSDDDQDEGRASSTPPLMERLGRAFTDAENPRDVRPRWRSHLRSSDQVVVTPDLAVFRKSRSHLLKTREADALTLLPQREPRLQVQEVVALEESTLATEGHTQHGANPGEPQVHGVMRSPRLALRRYDGAVTLPVNALAYHGRTLLPDSFRWHLSDVPTTWGIRDTGTRFARLQPHGEPRHLAGSYYHFGYNNSGHFGHLMTEALAKLWGWDAAKADDPSLKILCRLHPDRQRDPATRIETRLLPAYGIEPDDIVWADGAVTVDRLYACTPMWHNTVPFYAHAGLREVWSRLREGLLDGVEPPASAMQAGGAGGAGEKIFVTRRRGGNRWCRNVEQVEQLFTAQGFAVVQPEALTLHDQVAAFSQVRVVAGFGGAGMFNLAYARRLEAVVVLNQWAYEARNEQLFAGVQGAACHTFWSEPDVDHPAGGRAYEAHQSDWEFDLRLSDELTTLLDTL